MKIALFKESRPGETRVALTPDPVKMFVADGWQVDVEHDAGRLAHFSDDAYTAVGATIVEQANGDVNLRVNPPTLEEVARLREGSMHLSFLSPLLALDVVRALNERDITIASFDLLPRISRAQYMDALSSQATVSGYRAALAGATYLDRFFPLLTTAAGTIRPAKVLVMGVGVAGLQAIATAKRLGAKVRAYDVRTAAKEEAESAGATFVVLGVTADAAGGYARELTPEERTQHRWTNGPARAAQPDWLHFYTLESDEGGGRELGALGALRRRPGTRSKLATAWASWSSSRAWTANPTRLAPPGKFAPRRSGT